MPKPVLDVEEIQGEPFRFYVISRSQIEHKHLVDLEDYNFNGGCGCDGFKFRCEPELSRGANPSDRFRCWHIKRARSHFVDYVLPKLVKAMRGPQTKAPSDFVVAREAIQRLDLGHAVIISRFLNDHIDELHERTEKTSKAGG